MDLAKSRADSLAVFPRFSAAGAALRVRAQSKIAPTRALFERLSGKYQN